MNIFYLQVKAAGEAVGSPVTLRIQTSYQPSTYQAELMCQRGSEVLAKINTRGTLRLSAGSIESLEFTFDASLPQTQIQSISIKTDKKSSGKYELLVTKANEKVMRITLATPAASGSSWTVVFEAGSRQTELSLTTSGPRMDIEIIPDKKQAQKKYALGGSYSKNSLGYPKEIEMHARYPGSSKEMKMVLGYEASETEFSGKFIFDIFTSPEKKITAAVSGKKISDSSYVVETQLKAAVS